MIHRLETPRTGAVGLLTVLVFAGSLVFLLSGIRVGAGADTPPFHVDEASKLADTYFYQLFFERRAWDDPAWSADFFARTNPPLAKYRNNFV